MNNRTSEGIAIGIGVLDAGGERGGGGHAQSAALVEGVRLAFVEAESGM